MFMQLAMVLFTGVMVAQPRVDARLSQAVQPTRYIMNLTVDPAQERFSGTVRIPLDIKDNVPDLRLHASGLTVTKATLTVGKAAPVALTPGHEEEILVLMPKGKGPIKKGAANLELQWNGSLDGQKMRGLYRYKMGDTYWVGSQFEATDARRMAPCFDEPGFKVPLEMTLTVPEGLTAVTNGAVTSEKKDTKARTKTVTYATTPPLPTYLWAVLVGPYAVVTVPDTTTPPIRVLVPPGKEALATFAGRIAKETVKHLDAYFGLPYAYGKLDLITIGEFSSGAMENAGAITFREEALLLDEARASVAQKRGAALTIAHEIAHQWFGDVVTMAWWDDLWLNESFATWMASKVIHALEPSLQTQITALPSKRMAMGLDALPSTHPIQVPVESAERAREIFDVITYQKGGAVLSMLEAWLGADAFRDGLRGYMKAHMHKNAKAADLFAALELASGKPVKEVANIWITQGGHPLVTAKVACTAGQPSKVTLAQDRYALGTGGPTGVPWKTPVCVRYPDAGTVKTQCSLLSGTSGEMTLETSACPGWILPDANAAGFYTWSIEPAAWRELARNAGKSLPPEERLDMLANGWALVRANQLGADAYLDILGELAAEENTYVLGSMADRASAIIHLVPDENDRVVLRQAVATQFGPRASAMGWTPKADEDPATRELRVKMLAAMALTAEDPAYVAQSRSVAQQWLTNPNTVSSDVARVALASAARGYTVADVDALAARLPQAETPERRVLLVGALGQSRDVKAKEKGLGLSLTDTVRAQDSPQVLGAALQDDVAAPLTWSWLKANHAPLVARMPEGYAAWMPFFLTGFCTQAERDDVATFFSTRKSPGMEPRLAEALAVMDACIQMRRNQAPALKAHVEKLRKRSAAESPARPGKPQPGAPKKARK
jgi:alanyl aminopeptidase